LAVACQEEDIRSLKALIIGPPDSPYEYGFFEVSTCTVFSTNLQTDAIMQFAIKFPEGEDHCTSKQRSQLSEAAQITLPALPQSIPSPPMAEDAASIPTSMAREKSACE
jgi:hypothetical protein